MLACQRSKRKRGVVVTASRDAVTRKFTTASSGLGERFMGHVVLVVSLLTLTRQVVWIVLPEMAAACQRVIGFLSAAGNQTAGLTGPYRAPNRFFQSSRWAFREIKTKPQPIEQVYEEVPYTPQNKAKNPMKAVAIAWAIGFPSAIILFLVTKREVDKNRLKQLKLRQKLRATNEGKSTA